MALLGTQRDLRIATLIDYQKSGQQEIENLFKRKLLAKNRVLTFADFTGKTEADVEDMFDEDFYLRLVSAEYGVAITQADLTTNHPRIVVRLERYFAQNPLPAGAKYNHYRPARHLAEKVGLIPILPPTLDRFEAVFVSVNRLLG